MYMFSSEERILKSENGKEKGFAGGETQKCV